MVQDQTASDSNSTAGIIDVASSSAEFTEAGCDVNAESMTASISLDGFVTASISNSFTGQYLTGSLNSGTASLSFTIKVTGVKDELGNTLTLNGTTASVSYIGGTATRSYSGGAAYISASPSDVSPVASAGADGYVNKQVSITPVASAQRTVVFQTGGSATYVGSGLPFAYKFTVSPSGGSTVITGATVTAGNTYGISCSESGTTGIYYCAVPLGHTGVSAKAVKGGYETATLAYSLRASGRTAQQTGTINPTVNASGGSGQNYNVTPTPTPQLINPTPAPTLAPTATPTPTIYVPGATPAVSNPPSIAAKLFRKVNDPKVYVQGDDGLLRWVKTLAEFNAAGYKWADVKLISGNEFAKLKIAGKITLRKGVKWLNIRSAPSLRGKIIGRFLTGQEFNKKDASGVWFKITLPNGQDGWVHSGYVVQE